MINGNAIPGIIEASIAAVIIILACIIKYGKKVNIISGYDVDSVRDKDGLANWFGGSLLIAGVVAFVSALVSAFLPQLSTVTLSLFGPIILTGVIVAIAGGRKFKD